MTLSDLPFLASVILVDAIGVAILFAFCHVTGLPIMPALLAWIAAASIQDARRRLGSRKQDAGPNP
jgi:hypothetical protein